MPELIFIAIIALIVLGPQRLPGVLREVAKFIGQLRGMASELTSQFSEEIAMIEELDPRKLINEVTQPLNDLTKPLSETTKPDKKAETSKAAADTAASITTSKKSSASSTSNGEDSSSTEQDGDADQKDAADSDETVDEDRASSDDTKTGPQPQVQTDPSNVASTEPYKNRTANLNLIKQPAKDETPDSVIEVESVIDVKTEVGQDDSSQEDEENQIAPPEMQEKIAQAKVAEEAIGAKANITNGSTAARLVAGKSVTNNGKQSTTQDSESDSDVPNSDTSSPDTSTSTALPKFWWFSRSLI